MSLFLNKKILVVDDESYLLNLSSEYLKVLGCQALTAADGESALSVSQTVELDGIICDLSLPGISGLDVLAHFHTHHPHVPFIILSGTLNMQDAIGALQLGAWDFLQKPLAGLDLLKHTLQKALERAELLKSRATYSAQLEKDVATRTWSLIEQIQEQKRTELLLRHSIQEKEILLQEVHHRVKNNLQIITSIMDFQRSITTPLSVEETLVENQHRIMAMAMIHEGLYQSANLTQISARNYLDSITNHYLQEAMMDQKVQIHSLFEEATLDINKAFSMGLLYNEILSVLMGKLRRIPLQAGQPWQLQVAFQRGDRQGQVLWTTPAPLQWDDKANHELSRQLIQLLLAQARGTLTTNPTGAFSLTLTMPLE